MIKIEYLKTLGLCAISFTLVACGGGTTGGGGGGGGSPTTQTPPPPPPVAPPPQPPIVYDTPEFQQNPSLEQMNIQTAYENHATGEGIIVAVIDSGVSEIPEMQGQIHSRINTAGSPGELDDLNGHGTAMAGIIAARRDNATNSSPNNMHGSAYDAQIMSINATDSANCDESDCDFFNSAIAAGYNHAATNNVRVINESLGSDSSSAVVGSLVAAMQAAIAADILIVLPAGNRDDVDPAVTPRTATESAAQLSADVAYQGWANGQIIIAGSVDSDNTISHFSYAAGTDAMNVFLMAPGRSITTPYFDSTGGDLAPAVYVQVSGTSASTAQISGAAALLFDAFPSLSAAQVADLMLSTATDLGAPGVDPIYGRGLLNLEEAFRSQGIMSIAGTGFGAGIQVGDRETLSENNLIFSGGAFGADIAFSGALDNVMVLDKYERSFRVNFSDAVYAQQTGMSLEGFMDHGITSRYQKMHLGNGISMKLGWRHDDRFADVDKHLYSNHIGRERIAGDLRMSLSYDIGSNQSATFSAGMSMAEMMEDYRPDDYMAPNKHGFNSLMMANDTQAISYKNGLGRKTTMQSAFANSKSEFGEHLFGLPLKTENSLFLNRLSHQATKNLQVAIDFGMLSEKGSVLGAVSRGAVEIGRGARTGFVGAKVDYQLGSSSLLYARASYGLTKVDQSDQSLLGDLSTLKSYSYLLGVKSKGLMFDNDQFSFTFSQPLRLDGGSATISHVTSRNYETNQFAMANERISLNPSGTERDFELSYALSNVYGAKFQLNLLHQLNPGHIKSIPDATSVLFRIGSSF